MTCTSVAGGSGDPPVDLLHKWRTGARAAGVNYGRELRLQWMISPCFTDLSEIYNESILSQSIWSRVSSLVGAWIVWWWIRRGQLPQKEQVDFPIVSQEVLLNARDAYSVRVKSYIKDSKDGIWLWGFWFIWFNPLTLGGSWWVFFSFVLAFVQNWF